MQLNKLKETDWDMLVSWWDAWPNWKAPPKRILPDNGTGGFVVEHEGEFIVAGFLYFTNSESCLIEWIISNPNYKHRENRKTAIKHLITSIEEVAKSQGATWVFNTLQHPSLIKTHEELGYTKDPKPSYELSKNL